jgi:hypothetical protein
MKVDLRFCREISGAVKKFDVQNNDFKPNVRTFHIFPMTLKQFLFPFVAASLLFAGCASDPDADIRDVTIDFDFRRTDSLLLAASEALLRDTSLTYEQVYDAHLAAEQDFLFGWAAYNPLTMRMESVPDSVKRGLILQELMPILDDSAMVFLLDTLRQVFPYDYPLRDRLEKPLKRLKKNFPDIQIPAFRTHANGYVMGGDMGSVDQVVSAPGYISLGLHYFLGEKVPYYSPTLPQYIRRRFVPEMIEVAFVRTIAEEFIPPIPEATQPTLADKMIQAGIKEYFVQQLLPNTPDSLRLMYTARQMEWADYYEEKVYKELQPLMFSIDFKEHQQFLSDKPFTSTLSQESAPRLGAYCGWKMVQSFMEKNPDVTLAQLVERTDYQVIFQKSKYKP